jgi:toxin YhaV
MESPALTGWRLFIHPLCQGQLEKLTALVEKLASKDQRGYTSHPAAKILTTIYHYIREVIPRDPNRAEFRQGNTLGADNRHWSRAKFHGRYRLFFRFSTQQKFIIYAWVNDDQSLRKSGAKTDAYAVFKAMLESGELSSSFAELLRTSKEIE